MDKYYPKPLANAICSQNIVDSLIKKGNIVDVLTYKDSGVKVNSPNKNVKVYTVRPDLRVRLYYYAKNYQNSKKAKVCEKIATFLNRTRKLINIHFFPLYSISFPIRIFKSIEKLNQTNNYDLIISTYSSFENALGAMWFKRKNKKIKWILYTLDTFINYRHKFLNKKGNIHSYWLPKFLDICDMFIYMESRKDEYEGKYFEKWKNKMVVSDIPLMQDKVRRIMSDNDKKDGIEKWVYAGSLGSPHYKTEDLLKIFLGLKDNKKRVLYFYSSGKELEELKKVEKQYPEKIVCNYYISHDKLDKIYQEADVLVSIKYSNQISAKIFEYITYNKKIVHISGTKEDPDFKYLKQYSNCCILQPYLKSTKESVLQLEKFLNKTKTDINTNMSYFNMNRPEYTANLVINLIKEQK